VSDAPPVRGRKRRIIIPVVAIIAIVALIYGVRYLVYSAHHVKTDDAQISGHITTISPKIKGQVTQVFVDDNQLVHRGDKLVKLDDRDYIVALAQAQAALLQAAQERVDAALTHQIQSLEGQLLHDFVAIARLPGQQGQQAQIQRPFEELRRTIVHRRLTTSLSCTAVY